MTEFRWINYQLDLRYSTADMYRYSHFKNIRICSAALKLLQVNPQRIARIYLHTSLLLCPLLQLIFVKIGCDIHLSAQQCSCSKLSARTLRILEPFGAMLPLLRSSFPQINTCVTLERHTTSLHFLLQCLFHYCSTVVTCPKLQHPAQIAADLNCNQASKPVLKGIKAKYLSSSMDVDDLPECFQLYNKQLLSLTLALLCKNRIISVFKYILPWRFQWNWSMPLESSCDKALKLA